MVMGDWGALNPRYQIAAGLAGITAAGIAGRTAADIAGRAVDGLAGNEAEDGVADMLAGWAQET